MPFPRKISDLCTPAQVYFIVSVFALLVILFQNIGCSNTYHLGFYKKDVPSTLIIFVAKIIYILFWTWILNLICKDNHKGVAWLLVLFPFLLMFVIIGLIMLNM